MPAPTYIIGHKNPDADSICSAIGYAALKQAQGHTEFQAARCGNSNARIDAILNRFNTPLPTFVGDVTPRIKDIMNQDVLKAKIESTCAEALDLIDQHDVRAMPVVDKKDRVIGMISIFKLGEFFIPKPKDSRRMRHVHTSINHIISSLNATVSYVRDPENIEDLYVRIGAMDIRSFGKFTSSENTRPEESIIVVGDRYDIQQKSVQLGVRLLVITGNLALDDDVIELAKERGVSLIVSPYDSATTSWIIRTATELAPLVDRNVVKFGPDEKLPQVKRRVANHSSHIFCVVDDEDRLIGLFSKTDLLKPVKTNVVLVDHNETAQAVNGVNEVNIIEIIDHHRLDNPPTAKPIFFRNEIIGSTSSIIAEMFRENGIDPDPNIAGILMSGLISDTLNLQSPTSTERDAVLLPWLASIAKVEIKEIADLIFNSGSIVVSSKPADVITADCKPYRSGDISYSVSQVEELGYQNFWERSESITEALEAYRVENKLYFSCLLITDINSQSSLLLLQSPDEFIQEITYAPVQKNQIFDLPGIVSRKKQLIPYLSNLLENFTP